MRDLTPLALTTILICSSAGTAAWSQDTAVRWWESYADADASGPQVLGYWRFDGDAANFMSDSSSHQHQATLRGAQWNAAGKFGGCLESAAGHPVTDSSHGLHIARSQVLSPSQPFTVQLWVKAKDAQAFPDEIQPVLLDMKYVSYNHTGFMLSLTRAGADDGRRLVVEIGTGAASHHWYSKPLHWQPDVWRHVAFTYDALGTVEFFVDGREQGSSTVTAAGPMATATRQLAIGDRIGSLYRGFPGFIDEVRLTLGRGKFRPVSVEPDLNRFVFERMDDTAKLTASLVNQSGQSLDSVAVTVHLPDGSVQPLDIPSLDRSASHPIEIQVDTSLKPGVYEVQLTVELDGWGAEERYQSVSTMPYVITPRPLPKVMPVVMWGIGGTDGVLKEIPRLKQIGFTHCLGLRADYQKIWDEGGQAMPSKPETVRESREMLAAALENGVGIVASLSPGRWLRTAGVGQPFLRVDRSGQPYAREDVSGVFSQVQEFCFNTGAAMGRAYGRHPALAAALLHTEVRGESQVSFHPVEIDAYRDATGAEIPDEVVIKNGVHYEKLEDFPDNRVIPDDHPILRYLRWFWKEGDGWNGLHTRLHEGLKQHIRRDSFWTFHDPAVRAASIAGSGGEVDVLAHWTYSYPDPIRIGLCTDELLEMTRLADRRQEVMKMTQLIWYRSQTAPKNSSPSENSSPWVDSDPDADYITIAPMHLREAFWWKMARPIQGIMYHGWQSLVDSSSPGAYRYTNPNTRDELTRLIRNVVVPLGPTLMQVPDAESDVAFLESFTSQMFARRGTYGWNHTWAGDMYHILMYAQLQPRVLYEESLLAGGLDRAKLLVMADCDVLTESAAEAIQRFQRDGGLVIGDAEVCPAIQPDFIVPRYQRTKRAHEDRANLLEAARRLRQWLDPRYSRHLQSTNPDVVTRRRRFATSDYVFAINDRREYGSYVGGYGLVMEDGLPSETTLRINRESGFVYDLLESRQMSPRRENDQLEIPLQLGPCEGRVLMVTERPIEQVQITAPEVSACGGSLDITIEVSDGKTPIDAVVPLAVRIVDPEGVESEYSGHYGAHGGRQTLRVDIAPNDRTGMWQIHVKELASGKMAAKYFRITELDPK